MTAGRAETRGDADGSEQSSDAPVIGANLNGRPHRLLDELDLLDASGTTWLRAFIDVRRKLEAGTDPDDDPDVVALRRAARDRGCKLIVSLKWDFKANWGDKAPINVPPPGSTFEEDLHRCALRYLRAIRAPVDVVVLGNEPMWETLDEDVKVEDPSIVRFTRDLKERLVREGDHGDPAYLVGAFNRAHHADTREKQYPHFYREMLEFVGEDEDVDGIDLHVHYGAFREAEEMVAVGRAAVPDGTLMVTEFSPVWRYYRHRYTPIDGSDAGERFAREYGVPAGTTTVEYIEAAKRRPRPPGEVADFYDAMPWYNVDFVSDMYDLLDRFDVEVGTFGFLAGLGMRNEDWTSGWLPFHINFLFQPVLMQAEGGLENTAHPHYVEDYRRLARRDG